eukprot:scaffold227916_cov18-Tisochrysis_lutea.AAC.1
MELTYRVGNLSVTVTLLTSVAIGEEPAVPAASDTDACACQCTLMLAVVMHPLAFKSALHSGWYDAPSLHLSLLAGSRLGSRVEVCGCAPGLYSDD